MENNNKPAAALSVAVTETQTSIAENFGYTPAEIAVIQNTVAKGTSKIELAYFINVCKTVGLNPFIKEIWCYKDKKNNVLIFAGRDGFLTKAQQNPDFAGIRSCEVRTKDVFVIDVANNKIRHEFGIAERGDIVGAYAIAFRKGGEPTIEYVDFKTYNKGYNAWGTHPAEMIKKVAETHALKKAFGISGIQSEYDFNADAGVAVPIATETRKPDPADRLEVLKQLYSEKNDRVSSDDALHFERIIANKEINNYEKAIQYLNNL